MPAIEMKTELPGPKSRAVIERKERVVCDPLDLHVNAVIVITDEQLDEALDVPADSAFAARKT